MKKKKIVLLGAGTPMGQYILINALLFGFEVVAVTEVPGNIPIRNKNLKILETRMNNIETIKSAVRASDTVINIGNFELNAIDAFVSSVNALTELRNKKIAAKSVRQNYSLYFLKMLTALIKNEQILFEKELAFAV